MKDVLKSCFFPYVQDIHELVENLIQPSFTTESFFKCMAIQKKLHKIGYCEADVVVFMLNELMRRDGEIDRGLLLDYIKRVGLCQSRIANGTESQLQLTGLISSMWRYKQRRDVCTS